MASPVHEGNDSYQHLRQGRTSNISSADAEASPTLLMQQTAYFLGPGSTVYIQAAPAWFEKDAET